MNVEDSYEGAVRRLRRLGHAGVDFATPAALAEERDETEHRLRDLEELATLACDDNDRLNRELDGARHEIARLQHLVQTLQETLAGAPSDDPFAAPRRGRGAGFYLFMLFIVGAAAAAAFTLRPWERLRATPPTTVVTEPPAPPPIAPVVATPPPAIPKVEPTVPKVAPTIPKVAPIAVAPTVAPQPRASHHAAKHHATKSARHHEHKHGAAARSSKPGVTETDDPLGGVDL